MAIQQENNFSYFNKSDITKLCNEINMPSEAIQEISNVIDSYDFSLLEKYYPILFSTVTAQKAVTDIDDALKDNENKGYIWLTLYLFAALNAKEEYNKLSISNDVYYDTMAIFTRFVNEHKESFGTYGYDRQWWNYRQISLNLFRIGELEYEMCTYTGENGVINGETVLYKNDNIISVHIPSDAKLTDENCKKSFKMALEFFDRYYSSFNYSVMYCESWIISPNLKHVLNENSNIIKFLNNFKIFNFIPDSQGYKTWVFKNDKLTIDEFPQNTSLQKNIVAYLKQGGKIGAAEGIIKKSSI